MIYDRYDPAKNYDRHQFRADRVLQSAELNELQSHLIGRVAELGNVLFKDGDIVRDAGCIVDGVTGDVQLQSGALYLAGAVRGIGPAQFVIPIIGTVVIGVHLQESVVTELEDPTLLNPAVGTRGYMEPGAARLRIDPVWGVFGDGQPGHFWPVYEVVDGALKGKDAPPNIEAVTAAIQSYDRASTGGNYIIGGMTVRRGADMPDDTQTYIVAAGQARANGRGVVLHGAVRYVVAAAPELRTIAAEPHLSTGPAAQRIDVDFTPLAGIEEVTITAERTDQVLHGAVSGSLDPLPESSVLQIVEVKQGATTYVKNVDYKLTAGKVDWSLAGAEPAPGSNYSVKYQHIKVVEPTDVDAAGFAVAGAVADTLMLATYRYKVPRVDRLALSDSGDIRFLRGVASDWMPVPPVVPDDLLLLATIWQRWDATTAMTQDSPRMVPMSDLANIQAQLDDLRLLIAIQHLRDDASSREVVLKKSIFVDPLQDDGMRDAGVLQTGAIVGGAITLPIVLRASYFAADVDAPTTLAHAVVPIVAQTRRTGAMAVNPYQAFAPVQARIELDPAVDQMTSSVDAWTSSVTRRLVRSVTTLKAAGTSSETTVNVVSSTVTADQLCRPQTITFTAAGFAPGEAVSSVSFDGLAVQAGTLADFAVAPVANAGGVVTGRFNIPPNVPSGRKVVQIAGSGGSYGSAYYTAASWTENRVLQRVVTDYVYQYVPPPPPSTSPAVPEVVVTGASAPITPPPLAPPPADPTRAIVEQTYITYLGRVGEEAGVDYWVTQINAGLALDVFTKTFVTAGIENQEPNVTPAGRAIWEDITGRFCATATDPLAQTFVTPAAAHLLGVDLWFEAVGAGDVVVQLRTVSTGLPTQSTRAQARLAPAQIHTDGTATRALFAVPCYAAAGEELAIVVMCNDAQTTLSIAELGKWDGAAWVTAQPYTIGVLLSSSNASTWTAHQDRDIRFRVLAAAYSETVRNIDLGSLDVDTATDLMVLGLEEKPGAQSAIVYTVTLPDGTAINAASNQPIALTAPVTGAIHLRAQLRGDAVAGPVLHRGGQLLVGWLGALGDYVSRAISAGAGSRVRVIVDALLPSGAALAVAVKGGDVADVWSAPIDLIDTTPLDEGFHEMVFEAENVNEAMVQARLSIAGSPAARPFVRNVRMMVM